MEITLDQSQPLPSISDFIHGDDLDRFIDSLDDSFNAENFDFSPTSNKEASSPLQLSHPIESEFVGQPELDDSLSMVPSFPMDCSQCFLLREVIHTNGLKNARLGIHGGLGVFYHAIIEVSDIVDGSLQAMETSVIDFRAYSFEQVKRYLTDYGLIHVNNGYVLTQDSLSSFFHTLCAKMDLDVDIICNNGSQFPEQGFRESRQIVACNDPMRTEKTGISAQRERAANLHINDFADYFHLPILEASKEMRICSTVLKKVCRKYGMKRWPYRKVKSIDNKIKKLQDDLLEGNGQGAVSTQAEIEKHRFQRVRICQGFRPAQV